MALDKATDLIEVVAGQQNILHLAAITDTQPRCFWINTKRAA